MTSINRPHSPAFSQIYSSWSQVISVSHHQSHFSLDKLITLISCTALACAVNVVYFHVASKMKTATIVDLNTLHFGQLSTAMLTDSTLLDTSISNVTLNYFSTPILVLFLSLNLSLTLQLTNNDLK